MKRFRHCGYTLLELVMATATSTLLLAGMASSVYVASRALDIADGASATSRGTVRALDQITRDVQYATRFTERTSTAMTFTVPDRNGDGLPETIRYAWGGVSGDPLTYELNGVSGGALATNVTHVDFSYLTRRIFTPYLAASQPSVVFEGYSHRKEETPATSITIDTPAGTKNGDLLIAAVAYDGEKRFHDTDGWIALFEEDSNKEVTLAVWWKIADSSEPAGHTFSWDPSEEAYGWIMRFRGHDAMQPINNFSVNKGTSSTPSAPASSTDVARCLILRLGGFDSDDINVGDPGISNARPIHMDRSTSTLNCVSGGAAYAMQSLAGNFSAANFTLTASEEYVAASIAIAPEAEP